MTEISRMRLDRPVSRALVSFGLWMGCAAGPTSQPTPQILGSGTVSTEAPEFAAAFTPDGRELYFNRATADRRSLQIMTSRRTSSEEWAAATVAPFSGTFRDVDPFITPDGRRLFFSSDRPRQPGGAGAFATWYVERVGDGWSAPVDPGPPLNSTAGDVFFTMSRDGDAVFTSSRDGDLRIYGTRESRGRWDPPRPLSLGTKTDASNPAIAPSGRFLIVVRAEAGGAADLFLSCRTGDEWSEPRPLTAINSAYADFAPSVDANETTLTFTSERPGIAGAQALGVRPPGDLYRVSLAEAGIRCGQ